MFITIPHVPGAPNWSLLTQFAEAQEERESIALKPNHHSLSPGSHRLSSSLLSPVP